MAEADGSVFPNSHLATDDGKTVGGWFIFY
jgi:hypothetical protein